MDRLLPDLAHSLRRLSRAPGFATIAILTPVVENVCWRNITAVISGLGAVWAAPGNPDLLARVHRKGLRACYGITLTASKGI